MRHFFTLMIALLALSSVHAQFGGYVPNLKMDYDWSPDLQSWELQTETDYQYDDNGYRDQSTSRSFNGSFWEKDTRFEYANNPDGTLKLFIEKRWMNNEWLEHRYHRFTYNSQGQLITEIVARPGSEGNPWRDASKITWTYSKKGLLVLRKEERFEGDSWFVYERTAYTYNNQDQLTKELTQLDFGGEWYNKKRQTYTYNNVGLVDSTVTANWAFQAWKNQKLITQVYNQNELPIEQIDHREINDEWTPNLKHLTTYTNGYDPEETVTWKYNGNNYEEHAKTVFQYTLFIGQEELENATEQLEVYPNPGRDWISVKGWDQSTGSLSLLTIDGREISRITTGNLGNVVVSVQHLPEGLYFIRENNGAGRTARLVVQH